MPLRLAATVHHNCRLGASFDFVQTNDQLVAMFCVLYSFEVKPDQEVSFLQGWRGLTELIRDYEGGLGSRLHKVEENLFWAYAQWPDQKTWDESGDRLPKQAEGFRKLMRESCERVETIRTMEMVDDLLVR